MSQPKKIDNRNDLFSYRGYTIRILDEHSAEVRECGCTGFYKTNNLKTAVNIINIQRGI